MNVGKKKKKYLWLLGLIIVLICFFVLLPKNKEKSMIDKTLKEENPKAALIIAFQGFQDKEYDDTKEVLEENNITVETVSSEKGEAEGKFGEKIKIEKTLEEIKVDDYRAIVFIGGPGALDYVKNTVAHRIARETLDKGKILAAICVAPEILAEAQVLEGKKATVWSQSFDQEEVKFLEDRGAIFSNEDLVIDGKIVTANGPMAAKKFGQKIAELLLGENQ